MAKQIKVIQCPQCGSAQQTLIKEDHYKCGSCGAEYFLDNDDINVNIRHEVSGSAQTPLDPAKAKKIVFGILGAILAFIVLVIVSNIVSNYSSNKSVVNERVQERFKGSSIAHHSSKPIAFTLSSRSYSKGYQDKENSKNGYYLSFYDLEKNVLLKDTKIENINFSTTSSDHFKSSYFKTIDKNLVILNSTNILEVDFDKLTFKDITTDILNKYSEFETGVANIEFEYQHYGEGIKIMNNIGKSYTYYPANKHLKYIDSNNLTDSKINEDELIPQTCYMFTEKYIYFPDMPIQLMKVNYLYHTGGIETKPYSLRWERDYNSNQKDAKKLDYNSRKARVVSYEDFTPDRYYFEAKVLYQTDKTLLIKYKPTPAQDAPTLFQLLNLESKGPIWTKQEQLNTDFEYIKNVGLTDDYYIVHLYSINYFLIPIKDGDIQKVDLNKRSN